MNLSTNAASGKAYTACPFTKPQVVPVLLHRMHMHLQLATAHCGEMTHGLDHFVVGRLRLSRKAHEARPAAIKMLISHPFSCSVYRPFAITLLTSITKSVKPISSPSVLRCTAARHVRDEKREPDILPSSVLLRLAFYSVFVLDQLSRAPLRFIYDAPAIAVADNTNQRRRQRNVLRLGC